MKNDKRIAVVGIGGVGGYLAGLLGRTCENLTLVARGERLAALKQQGLTLHSDYKGEIHIVPKAVVLAEELPEQDIIFLCVKTYSLEEVCRQIQAAVTDHTLIIPVMNGVDTSDRVREYLGKGIVVDSVIYIVTFANPDYSITQQGKFSSLKLGCKIDSGLNLESLDALLSEADIDHELSEDVEAAIWKKYMLNCAYNVATAYYDNTIGELREDSNKAKEYEDLVYEALTVAQAKGIHLEKKDADEVIFKFYHEYGDELTSSLQRDLRAGRQSELAIFGAYLVGAAEEAGVEVPVSKRMYEGLQEKAKKH